MPTFPMQLQEIKQGDALILTVQGHLDTATAGAFEERVLKLVEQGERRVLVDCALMDYVNSSGLKVFLVAAKQLDHAGGKLVLCGLTSSVQMIFEMIGFTKIMTITGTRDEALQVLANGATA